MAKNAALEFSVSKIVSTNKASAPPSNKPRICSLYEAHAQGRASDADLVAAEIVRTHPLSVVMAERIEALRAWAAERTVKAD